MKKFMLSQISQHEYPYTPQQISALLAAEKFYVSSIHRSRSLNFVNKLSRLIYLTDLTYLGFLNISYATFNVFYIYMYIIQIQF